MPRSQRKSGMLAAIGAGLAGFLVVSGCVTGEADDEGAMTGETHYTLHRGETKIHPAPLPSETPIMVERFKPGGGSVTSEGFRGWDFNGDGKFEMVDVLGPEGRVEARLYDFDADGTIDEKTMTEALRRQPPRHELHEPGFAPSSEPPIGLENQKVHASLEPSADDGRPTAPAFPLEPGTAE